MLRYLELWSAWMPEEVSPGESKTPSIGGVGHLDLWWRIHELGKLGQRLHWRKDRLPSGQLCSSPLGPTRSYVVRKKK